MQKHIQQKCNLSFFMGLLGVFTILFIPNATAVELSLSSSDNKVALLELYTSQGCSSCPPAERWLNKFEADKNLWQTFIPLNFHVDYWDYLGWKDPFADARFSTRQRWYEQLGLSKNVATPGFIVDGKGWNGWFYGQQPKFKNEPALGQINAHIKDDHLRVEFSSKTFSDKALNVHVAIVGFNLTTDVTNGENRGRALEHDFVVLAYDAQYLVKKADSFRSKLTLPDVSKFDSVKKGIVVWISPRNSPRPIQAVGDWL